MVELTNLGRKFAWSEACETAFTTLKKAPISANVTGYPLNDGGDFILDEDASNMGIGIVLHQV